MSEQLAVFIDFENVALWAEQEFLDFELTPLMEYLKSRGPVVIKRAYGDWGRFSRYREELMNNSVDLIQIYSIRAGKNRADIRMALDAVETAITREQINTFVIVSGDSDFGPLVSKLREYSRYTLGLGPRDVTHPLLVKACDEFVYLESVISELSPVEPMGHHHGPDNETARNLLTKALRVHAQRGEVPILAAKLKQTMLLMDSAFNEANFGFSQFKSWLETNDDLLDLFLKDLQLYAAPLGFNVYEQTDMQPWVRQTEQLPAMIQAGLPVAHDEMPGQTSVSLRTQYQQILSRLKMTGVDRNTRRDVLRDIYRILTDRPGHHTTDELLEHLCERYESQGLIRSKTTLRQIWQMGFRQRAFDYGGEIASVHAPVQLAEDIDSEASFVHRAESGFVYAVINAGVAIDEAELASILLNDREQVDYIESLLTDLENRELILADEDRYVLPGQSQIPFASDPVMQPICQDIEIAPVPENIQRTADKARSISKTAMLQRSQDFSASARSYLVACRVQWDAIINGEMGATLEELRWYMASYASVKAGELSQIHRDYSQSRPYYKAFFKLVQEDDPLWARMRGLINPMLSYYWINAWRELGLSNGSHMSSTSSPAEIAIAAATYENQELSRLWFDLTRDLAEVNPGLVRRVSNQIRLGGGDSPAAGQVADKIEQMLIV
ncbi:MAG: NYN domain-containing protein [Chloroflexota bacterium]